MVTLSTGYALLTLWADWALCAGISFSTVHTIGARNTLCPSITFVSFETGVTFSTGFTLNTLDALLSFITFSTIDTIRTVRAC